MRAYERLLKYVSYETTSDENSQTCPSSAKELVLADELVEELKAIGVADAHVDKDGYVYGSIPATKGAENEKTIGLIAHMDTAPAMSGADIKPRIINDYDGADIVLNEKLGVVMDTVTFPQLRNYVGQDLIVTDGTTLLGADDKAGIAEIMTAAAQIIEADKACEGNTDEHIAHGKICIAFTPDNGDGNGGNTDVAGEEQTGEGSIQSEYDINGVGISSDDSTEETTSSDGEIQQAEKKPMPKAVKILLTVLWWAVIIVGAVFALRYAELMRRKKLAENAPEKAAAEIYRMLARLAAMQGVCVSAEKLPEQLKTDFGIECGDIVSAALRARFGQNGSVSAKDAAVSAKQYRTAAEKLISGLSAEKTVLAKIIMLDRYSK